MIGQTLSHFEITAKLGEGGMGEVYRATDPKLGRDVAIKVLPEAFTRDPERLARFEREAKVLASLNHTSIASIHEIGSEAGVHFLVMELADGEDLTERIARGPIPLEDALPIAGQIAEALESAHAQRIIHRDLKPANVKVTAQGKVKVLDFGLAKALEGQGDGSDGDISLSLSPTITRNMTGAGVILGTAGYMSPEQAKGQEVDRRADIWSFGVLLWEMLVGRRLFEGDSISDTLAAVLREEIDPSNLPRDTPPEIRALLARCLDRDPNSRLQDIGEARIALAALASGSSNSQLFALPAEPSPADSSSARGSRLPWALAAVLAAFAALASTLWLTGRGEPAAPPLFSSLTAPQDVRLDIESGLAFSPDGSRLAFVAVGDDRMARIWIRTLSEPGAEPLEGTEGAKFPFWSPDGTQLAFFADHQLKRTSASGGAVRSLATVQDARGGSWGPGGEIVYVPDFRTGLMIIPQSGGTPSQLTERDLDRGEMSHRFPYFLPDGKHLLFLAQTHEGGGRNDESTIEAVAVTGGERTIIVNANSSMAYASGQLLYWHQGSLMAQAFDVSEKRIDGEAVPVAQDIAYSGNEFACFSVSQNGRLAFQSGFTSRGKTRLYLLDREGQSLSEPTELGTYENIALSHDGQHVAFSTVQSIWTLDLSRGTSSRLTFEDGDHFIPRWSPEDDWIYYSTDRSAAFETYRLRVSGRGAEELIFSVPQSAGTMDVSPDGKSLVLYRVYPETDYDIERYSLETETFEPLLNTRFFENLARISPDGRWLAFSSAETGRFEVSILPLTDTGSRYAVSRAGGAHPVWSPRGDELFFFSVASELMSVPIGKTENGLQVGVPKSLFPIRHVMNIDRPFDVMPDGNSFLINQYEPHTSDDAISLIQNWRALLEK